MTIDELKQACRDAIEKKISSPAGIVLVNKKGLGRPLPAKGFPRPQLLCQNSRKESVWMYNAEKLLAALEKEHTICDRPH